MESERPSFALEELRHEEGRVVVRGTWSGVRGMRFVRPTLVADGRRALATLEHKPWAPDGAGPWTAAFPWDAGEIDPRRASIDVAPSVTVRLAGGPTDQAPPPPDPVAVERVRFERRATEVDYLRGELRRAEGERDRALAQRDEAVRDREAAVRTRGRMEVQRAEAVTGFEEERRARQAAEARRDEALRQADDVRRQRDELHVAYRALEARLQQQAAREAPPPRAAAEPREEAEMPAGEPEEPLGVRTLPAVTPELPSLVGPGARRARFTELDLWAFRFFGGVAAVCFILLLVSLLRVFL